MLRWQWLLVGVIVLSLAGCQVTSPSPNRPVVAEPYQTMTAKGYPEGGILVDADWVAARLDDPALRVIDVSPLQRYRAGHLPRAVHAWWQDAIEINNDVYGMLAGAPKRTAWLSSLGIDRQTTVVVYDDEGGRWAARLVWLLEFLGHNRVHLLDGGAHAWQASGRALTTATVQPRPRRFEEIPQPDRIIEPEGIASLATAGGVVDGRSAEERNETWGGRLRIGTIPGAVPIPWSDHLTGPGGSFVNAPVLRARYGPLIETGRPLAVYGQFGAGAALPYVALRALGVPTAALYDGSWAEWGAVTAPAGP